MPDRRTYFYAVDSLDIELRQVVQTMADFCEDSLTLIVGEVWILKYSFNLALQKGAFIFRAR